MLAEVEVVQVAPDDGEAGGFGLKEVGFVVLVLDVQEAFEITNNLMITDLIGLIRPLGQEPPTKEALL